jgi:hypothetical protein
MNCRTTKITILTLLVIVLSLAGPRQAAAVTICGANISAACTITSAGTYTVTGDFSVSGSSNQGSVCNPSGGNGTGICLACGGSASCNTGSYVSNVTIDLGGHTISAGSNANDAICGGGNAGVTIKNGIINGGSNGFSGAGVAATGANARIERLQVTATTSIPAGSGIDLGSAAVAADSVVNGYLYGISCGTDCVISRNVVASTAPTGYTTKGIAASSGGLIEENTVMGASSGGTAIGLSLGTSTGYGENVLMNTTNVSGGTSMGKNICSGNSC